MIALQSLGAHVSPISYSDPTNPYFFYGTAWRIRNRLSKMLFGDPADIYGVNRRILHCTEEQLPDFLWLDKALMVRRATLEAVRAASPSTKIIGFSADDMNRANNQSKSFLESLPLFHAFITTKSYNVPELQALGGQAVEFMDNAYCARTHVPPTRDDPEWEVGFTGTHESERADTLDYLSRHGVRLLVTGGEWPPSFHPPGAVVCRREVWGPEYVQSLARAKISLCFLRKANRDLQTTRSVEIPACGRFMLAERTVEHRRLFKEGIEAEFFSSKEELLDKCKWYSANDAARDAIARCGHKRAVQGGYSYEGRFRWLNCLGPE